MSQKRPSCHFGTHHALANFAMVKKRTTGTWQIAVLCVPAILITTDAGHWHITEEGMSCGSGCVPGYTCGGSSRNRARRSVHPSGASPCTHPEIDHRACMICEDQHSTEVIRCCCTGW